MFSYHGGMLWIDFVNTQSLHQGVVEDGLARPQDLPHWLAGAELAGLVPPEWPEHQDLLPDLHDLRAHLRRIAETTAETGEFAEEHRLWLNGQLAALPGVWSYAESRAQFTPAGAAREKVRWLLLRSLLDFLSDGQTARLKKCGNHQCIQYYYDTSKNNTRRWCRMEVCGNREKARRHHRRKSGDLQEETTS